MAPETRKSHIDSGMEDLKQLKFPHRNPRVAQRCVDSASLKKIQQTLTQIDFVKYSRQEADDQDLNYIVEEPRPSKRRKTMPKKPANLMLVTREQQRKTTGSLYGSDHQSRNDPALDSRSSSTQVVAIQRATTPSRTPKRSTPKRRVEIPSSQSPMASPLSVVSLRPRLRDSASPEKLLPPSRTLDRKSPYDLDQQWAESVETREEKRDEIEEIGSEMIKEWATPLSALARQYDPDSNSGHDMRERKNDLEKRQEDEEEKQRENQENRQEEQRNERREKMQEKWQESQKDHIGRGVVQSRGLARVNYSTAVLKILDSESEAEESDEKDEHVVQQYEAAYDSISGESEILPASSAQTEAALDTIPSCSAASLTPNNPQSLFQHQNEAEAASAQLEADLRRQTQINQVFSQDSLHGNISQASNSSSDDQPLHPRSTPQATRTTYSRNDDKLQFIPSSQATTVDTTPPSPQRRPPSISSSPLLRPHSQGTHLLSSPVPMPPESNSAATASCWDGPLLTESQMLPDSVLNFSPLRPPAWVGSQESWAGADLGN